MNRMDIDGYGYENYPEQVEAYQSFYSILDGNKKDLAEKLVQEEINIKNQVILVHNARLHELDLTNIIQIGRNTYLTCWKGKFFLDANQF